MARENLITGIDIGSSKVSICSGILNEDKIQIVGLSAVPHAGLRHGIINDPEESVSSITAALDDVERMVGSRITHALVTINGSHIETVPAKGVVAASKANGLIDHHDVERAVDSAKAIAIPQNRELIHAFPHSFTVDNQDGLRDPVGMSGMRLESNMIIVSASSVAVRNLDRATQQAGVAIQDMIFSPLAVASLVTNKSQRDSGVIVIDIGAESTSFAVYEEGNLKYCGCVPIGSTRITKDLAIGLKINLVAANKIKLKHGSALPDKIRDSEMVSLAQFDPEEHEKIPRKQISTIVEARVVELFTLIKEDLQKIEMDEVLAAGAVITGGGSAIEGITQQAKNILKIPATIGYPETPLSGLIDKLDNPIYYASVGLVVWGIENSRIQTNWKPGFDGLGGIVDRLRGVFKNFTN